MPAKTAKAAKSLAEKYVTSVFQDSVDGRRTTSCSQVDSLQCYPARDQLVHTYQTNGQQVEIVDVDLHICLFPLTHCHTYQAAEQKATSQTKNDPQNNKSNHYVEFDLLFSKESVAKILDLYNLNAEDMETQIGTCPFYSCCSRGTTYVHYRDVIQFLYHHQRLSVDHLTTSSAPEGSRHTTANPQFQKLQASGKVVTSTGAQKLSEAIALAKSLTDLWRRQWQRVRPGNNRQWDSKDNDSSDNARADQSLVASCSTSQRSRPQRKRRKTAFHNNNNQVAKLERRTLEGMNLAALYEHLAPDIQLQLHQEYGVRWMYLREQLPYFGVSGGILADSMGLGKTLQTLCLIVSEPQCCECGEETVKGTAINLIVCKLSILHQWSEEVQKFFPQLAESMIDVFVAHPSASKQTLDWNAIDHSAQTSSRITILLTTYDQIRGWYQKDRQPQFFQQVYHRIILDEGHQIATPTSATAVALSSLRARHRWVLSGSPYRNSPRDLYSLAVPFLKLQDSFLEEERFGRKARWNRAFTRMDAIREYEDTGVIPKFNLSALSIRDEARVEAWLNVLLLRRTLDDQQPFAVVPERVNVEHVCGLSDTTTREEAEIYEHVRNAVENFVLQELGETFTFTSVHGGVMLLRRICVSIDLLLKSEEDGHAMWQGQQKQKDLLEGEETFEGTARIPHLTKHHLLGKSPKQQRSAFLQVHFGQGSP